MRAFLSAMAVSREGGFLLKRHGERGDIFA